jgi:hypothetical protein
VAGKAGAKAGAGGAGGRGGRQPLTSCGNGWECKESPLPGLPYVCIEKGKSALSPWAMAVAAARRPAVPAVEGEPAVGAAPMLQEVPLDSAAGAVPLGPAASAVQDFRLEWRAAERTSR